MPKKPQVISFINMKGGVGKTTLAVNVAYGLAIIHQKQVLIVDCDPQFNATQYILEDDVYFAHIEDNKKGTLVDIFVPRRPGAVDTVKGSARGTNRAKMPLSSCTVNVYDGGNGRGRLDLMPSHLALMEIETSKRLTETRLKKYIEASAGRYEYVILDCPPTISIFTQAAVLASQKYIVPLKPDPLSVIGLPLLERWFDEFCEDAGIEIKQVGLVFTLVRGNRPTKMREVMDDIRSERGDAVFDDCMSEATVVAESVDHHQPVFRYKPHSNSAKQSLAITMEFLRRTQEDGT